MKNKTILLLFILLVGGFIFAQFAYERQKKDFRVNLIAIDTTQVTAIKMYPQKDQQEAFLLVKEGDVWAATKGNVTTSANSELVKDIINSVVLIRSQNVATQNPKAWTHYQVDDATGSRIKIYSKKDLLEDFVVGLSNFDRNSQETVTYIRLVSENEIYTINGNLNQTINQPFNAFRNNQIVKLPPNDIHKISLTTLDSTIIYQKKDSLWTANNSNIAPIHIDAYLRKIQDLKGISFDDDFDETMGESLLYQTLSLESDQQKEPVVVKIYRDTMLPLPFTIYSSINKGCYFSSDLKGVYQQLVINLE